jgi:hypothetical protein
LIPVSRTNLPAQLVDQSLVITEETLDGATWYRFLETIRAYAIEKLTHPVRSRSFAGERIAAAWRRSGRAPAWVLATMTFVAVGWCRTDADGPPERLLVPADAW